MDPSPLVKHVLQGPSVREKVTRLLLHALTVLILLVIQVPALFAKRVSYARKARREIARQEKLAVEVLLVTAYLVTIPMVGGARVYRVKLESTIPD
jgi:hypothetical protein